ncbi:fatty acid desaturase family protein [Vibrio maritimus]|uniref:fatty acid desaturase family protein n=1 Tax=Vibrio maritimus TaxID=990268 RepID=UPI003736FCD6
MILYKELNNQLVKANCFKRPKAPFFIEILVALVVCTLSYLTILSSSSTMITTFCLIGISVSWVRAGFIAHEAYHHNIFVAPIMNKLIGHTFLTLLSGVSYSHFCSIHKRHHAKPEGSIAYRPLGGTLSLQNRLGPKVTKRYQAKSLWFLSIFRAFGLHIDSLIYLWAHKEMAKVDIAMLVGHYFIGLVVPSFALGLPIALLYYLIINMLAGFYVGPLLLLSHTGLNAEKTNHDPLLTLLATTRNIDHNWLLEIVLKGTREHVEHHLFPAIPYKNLRVARTVIESFCHFVKSTTYNTTNKPYGRLYMRYL